MKPVLFTLKTTQSILAATGAYTLNKKEKILFILLQLFLLTLLLPYNDIVSGVITGGLLLCCLLYNSPADKLKLFKERKQMWWMMLFIVWMFISLFNSQNKGAILPNLDPRLALGYFPLSIGLVQLRKEVKTMAMLGFAVLTLLVCLACLAIAIVNFANTGNADYLYNDVLTAPIKQQSIYISMLVTISIYSMAWFLFFKAQTYKWLLAIAIIFLFGISYLLASRNLMIVLSISSLMFVGYYIIKQKQYVKGAAVLGTLLLLGAIVFTVFPKTLNRFQDIGFTKFDYQQEGTESYYTKETTAGQWNGANFRIAAWRCGWELFKQYPITGTHLADKQDKVLSKYQEKNFQFALKTKKNLHNNYLDILVGTGAIGLILFLMGWVILPLRTVIQRQDYLSMLIILTICIAMITEVYFDRSLGGMLVGFFFPFLLTDQER